MQEKEKKIQSLEMYVSRVSYLHTIIDLLSNDLKYYYFSKTKHDENIIIQIDDSKRYNTYKAYSLKDNQSLKLVCNMETSHKSGYYIDILNNQLKGYFTFEDREILKIEYISTNYRRLGYASALLSSLFPYAKRIGYSYIIGDIQSFQEEEQSLERVAFYKTLGFNFYPYSSGCYYGIVIKNL